MVTNSFQHAETKEIVTHTFATIQAQTEWQSTHPQYSIIFLAATRIGDPFHLGVQKVPDDFRQGIIEPMKRYWKEATSHDGHTKVGKIDSRSARGSREI
jgi:hypothetical protein